MSMLSTFRKPSAEAVRKFLADQARLDFTYSPVGATAGRPPAGYRLNRTRERLGRGRGVFDRAKAALQRWEQFRIGWVEIQPPDAPVAPGVVLAIVANRLGLWWLNACRVVYVVDEDDPTAPSARFGAAFGTLPGHVGAGEERFQVEWDAASGEVWYEVASFSQPHLLLTRLGFPYMRWSQRVFGRQSAEAMIRAIGGRESEPVPPECNNPLRDSARPRL